MASKLNKPNKSKLEYTDEPEIKEVDEPDPEPVPIATPIVPPPSMKKARSEAQKATTARMRVKLEERRRDLVVIKQEAKETALLQQIELKAHIKAKIAKQLKTKADDKMRQMLLEDDDEDADEDESEPEEYIPIVRKKQPLKRLCQKESTGVKGGRVCETPLIKQLPSGRKPPYATQELPSIRFV